MKNRYKTSGVIAATAAILMLASCTEDPNSPGVEYMADMYRSPAIEAYVDYENLNHISARTPVEGTISYTKREDEEFNMPYPYPNTAEGYEAAGAELKNPLPTMKKYIEQGQEIYSVFCIHCHGESGDGDGSITQAAGGEFPVVPAYSTRQDLPEGKMFHSITYGKGLMGPHKSQLDQRERWILVQYVKTLMRGETPEFDEEGYARGEGYDNRASDYDQDGENGEGTNDQQEEDNQQTGNLQQEDDNQ